jgi:hypothetical protein
VSTVRVSDSTRSEAQHPAWEREIKRVRLTARLLAAALLALCIRSLVSGVTFASILTATILAALLLTALLLTRYGQKIEPKESVQAAPRATRRK